MALIKYHMLKYLLIISDSSGLKVEKVCSQVKENIIKVDSDFMITTSNLWSLLTFMKVLYCKCNVSLGGDDVIFGGSLLM